jgi:hypothetical protein
MKASFSVIALFVMSLVFTGVSRADDTVVRWDIIRLNFPACPNPGGNASALANDNSKITVTGSGTFKPDDPEEVTGGGTWQTASGSGTYQVRRLVRWDRAPGTLACSPDPIPGEISAGLVVLSIAYSDGSKGILVVSCHLVGTPDSVFEGITASKGFVDYWNRVPPGADPNANRTNFHIQRENEND